MAEPALINTSGLVMNGGLGLLAGAMCYRYANETIRMFRLLPLSTVF